MKKIILVLFALIFVISYIIYSYNSNNWQLNLYGDKEVLMRLEYSSKESCLSAGKSYYRNGKVQYKRFDCGLNCKYTLNQDKYNLLKSGVCENVCDNYGCK